MMKKIIVCSVISAFVLIGTNLAFSADKFFKDADCEGRDFSGQNLEGANFEDAELDNANFKNANLNGANFKGEKKK